VGSCENGNEISDSVKGGIFFTVFVIISFSRRTLLLGVSYDTDHIELRNWTQHERFTSKGCIQKFPDWPPEV